MISFILHLCFYLLIIKLLVIATTGRCRSNVCLVGKTAIVTGGTSGIGLETALNLASRGCRVIIANPRCAEEKRKFIVDETGNPNIVKKYLNLGSLESVRQFADDIKKSETRLDMLINNAGVVGFNRVFTRDGLLKVMQVNHLGPFLLTHLLIGLLKNTPKSRIIFVSSSSAFVNKLQSDLNAPPRVSNEIVHSITDYANSKMCNIITSNIFAQKLKPFGVTCNSVHPGFVRTPVIAKFESSMSPSCKVCKVFVRMLQTLSLLMGKSAFDGAQTSVHCAISKDVCNVSGEFFVDCRKFWQPSATRNSEFCTGVWMASELLVGLKPHEKI